MYHFNYFVFHPMILLPTGAYENLSVPTIAYGHYGPTPASWPSSFQTYSSYFPPKSMVSCVFLMGVWEKEGC